MSSMRGIDTPVRQRRRRVFKEVANLAYNSTNLKDDMEALPYKIVDYEESEFWESVYRDRAIIRERVVKSALMMQFVTKSVPVRLPAVLELLHLTMWEEP